MSGFPGSQRDSFGHVFVIRENVLGQLFEELRLSPVRAAYER